MTRSVTDIKPEYRYPRRKVIRALLRPVIDAAFLILSDLRIEGRENLPKRGPVLLAGNHFSFVDPVAMIRATPWPLEFLGGAETPNAPRFFHWVPKVWGRLAVYRGTGSRYAIDGGVAVLKQGGVVGIFPEAGSGAAVLRPPRPGAAFIAAQAGARIVPMGFVGMTEIFPRFREGRRARATVRIGKPIGPFQVSGRGRVRRRQLDQISDLIMQRIAELIPPEQRGFYSDDPALRAAAQAFEYAWADEPEF